MNLVYFSGHAGNTHRFVGKLDLPQPALRIPLRAGEPSLEVSEPYVLVLPTYGAGRDGGAVPKQVIRFLNDTKNRSLIRGVIASGNTNFGPHYALAGEIVSQKCSTPVMYQFELLGTDEDVANVQKILERNTTQ